MKNEPVCLMMTLAADAFRRADSKAPFAGMFKCVHVENAKGCHGCEYCDEDCCGSLACMPHYEL